MNPEARASFPDFLIACGEGRCDWMYGDRKGLVTTGIGQMLPTPQSALAFDWRNADGTASSISAVEAAWMTIRNHGELAGHGGGAYRGLTSIRATQASIDARVLSTVDAFEVTLRAQWPGWYVAPPSAQKGLMRLAWALGPAFAVEWPKLHAAWVSGEWETCADECRIPELDIDEPRANDLTAALFRGAAA